MLIYEYKTLVDAFEGIFRDRRQRNPRYSLRAFARDLDLAPSSVSEIFSGNLKLSPARTADLAKKLCLTKEQTDYVIALAEHANAKTPHDKKRADAKLREFALDSPLVRTSRDQIDFYSSWENLATVEALKLRNAKRTISWLADAIGATEQRVEEVCQLLCKHNFIVKNSDDTFSAVLDKSTSIVPGAALAQPPLTQTTIRQFHANVMHQAIAALDEQPLNERDFSAVIYASSKSQTPQVKEAIKNLRRSIMAAGELIPDKESVYCLSVQWFKLAQTSEHTPDSCP